MPPTEVFRKGDRTRWGDKREEPRAEKMLESKETHTSGSESSTSSLSFSIASQIPIRALTVRLKSSRTRRLYATVCFSVHPERAGGASERSRGYDRAVRKAPTMLFTVELFNTVASFVVLTETVFLLGFVKDGLVVPVSSGGGVINFSLQNVDCTRNEVGSVC